MKEGTSSVDSDEKSTYQRVIADVCSIFRDITGAEASPSREGSAIMHWVREENWGNFEFRQIIDYEFKNPKCRQYYLDDPTRLNLRSMFNPKRREILLDVMNGLKFRQKIEHHASIEESSLKDSQVRLVYVRMNCGAKIPLTFAKQTDKSQKTTWARNFDAYEQHATEDCCFPLKAHTIVVSSGA